MKSRKLLAILAALLAPALLAAQGGPSMILEFVSGSELTVQIGGTTLAYPSGIAEDDAIPVGALVKTGPTTTAELRLKPNGTLLTTKYDREMDALYPHGNAQELLLTSRRGEALGPDHHLGVRPRR
ncbi:MAG TPA: hypothetical protein P5117_13005, partial [Spirochaetia bacterium]|nr:hypothetical protein [Spirochaetia bacterium]